MPATASAAKKVPGPVRATSPAGGWPAAVAWVPSTVVGTVVATTVVGAVVAAAADVAVELGAAVVGAVVAALWKVIGCCAVSVPLVPKATAHTAPAAACAAVGGHGYKAASAAPSLPALSAPVPGGPIVPVCTVNGLFVNPPLVRFWVAGRGLLPPTGICWPATATVGWPAAVLHSVIPPIEPANPDPVTLTLWPSVSPVLGVTVRLGAALAPSWPTTNMTVASTPATATPKSPLRPTTNPPFERDDSSVPGADPQTPI